MMESNYKIPFVGILIKMLQGWATIRDERSKPGSSIPIRGKEQFQDDLVELRALIKGIDGNEPIFGIVPMVSNDSNLLS